jgi:hypothetical protein
LLRHTVKKLQVCFNFNLCFCAILIRGIVCVDSLDFVFKKEFGFMNSFAQACARIELFFSVLQNLSQQGMNRNKSKYIYLRVHIFQDQSGRSALDTRSLYMPQNNLPIAFAWASYHNEAVFIGETGFDTGSFGLATLRNFLAVCQHMAKNLWGVCLFLFSLLSILFIKSMDENLWDVSCYI